MVNSGHPGLTLEAENVESTLNLPENTLKLA